MTSDDVHAFPEIFFQGANIAVSDFYLFMIIFIHQNGRNT